MRPRVDLGSILEREVDRPVFCNAVNVADKRIRRAILLEDLDDAALGNELTIATAGMK